MMSPSVFVVETSNVIIYVPNVVFTSPIIELDELAPSGWYLIEHVSNNGNAIENVEIITPAPLREWSVDVVPDDFNLNPGQTKQVEIRVTPPVGLNQDDTYKFTIIVQPEDTPVAGQPIELTVNAEISSINLANGLIGKILVYSSIIFGSILVLTLFLRTRKENKIISEALLSNQED